MQYKEKYYQVLELPYGSGLAAIKKAYRKLAMQYHPDKNQSPDAREKFIAITEAYEILIGERSVPRVPVSFTRKSQAKKPKTREEIRKEQREERIRRAKETAEKRMKMRYEEFLKDCEDFDNSPYRIISIIGFYLLYFLLLALALTVLLYPLIRMVFYAETGALFFLLFMIPLSYKLYLEAQDWKADFMPYLTKEFPLRKRLNRKYRYRRPEDY